MKLPYVICIFISFARVASCFRNKKQSFTSDVDHVVSQPGGAAPDSGLSIMGFGGPERTKKPIVPVVDPVFAGSTLGIMTVAKVANAAVTGLRYLKTKNALELSQKVTDFLAKRRAGTCLIARQLQMQSTLAHLIVFSFVDSASEHIVIVNKTLYDPSAVEMFSKVDEVARQGVAQLQNATRDAVRATRNAIERLVQTSCHTGNVNEFLLMEKVENLQKRHNALQLRVILQSIDAFFHISITMKGATLAKKILASGDSIDGGLAWDAADQVGNPLQLQARWDAAAQLLVSGLDNLAAKSKFWAFLEGSTQKIFQGLGAIATFMVTASLWYNFSPLSPTGACLGGGEIGCEVQTMFFAAIVTLEKSHAIFSGNDPKVQDVLVLVVSVLTFADEIMGLVGADFMPGLAYARLTIRTLDNLLTLTLNAIEHAEEEREFAVNNYRARSTIIGQSLTYTRSTCGGLYNARELAKKEQGIVTTLSSRLKAVANGSESIQYDRVAAGSSYASFCFLYPAMCRGLSKFLLAEPSIAEYVAHHKHTIVRLSEAAPISDLAYLQHTSDRKSYVYMGFRKVKGLTSLMTCRGCVSTIVSRIALMDSPEKFIATQEAFARGEDFEGQPLPEHATLNFVQYSSSHHHIAFYKAHLDDLIDFQTKKARPCPTCSHQALVDLREIRLRVDDEPSDEVDIFRDQSRNLLIQHGAVVMSWRKTQEAQTLLSRAFWHGIQTINSAKHPNLVRGNGHSTRVDRYDTFIALVAIFLPKESFPASTEGFTDWRSAVATGLDAPFTHAAVLRGCGCQLLFFSEFATFRPDYPHEPLRQVRVRPVLQPNLHEQKSRCGYSVGVWISSAPLSLPVVTNATDRVQCRLVSEVPLAGTIDSHHQVYVHLMNGSTPRDMTMLATVDVPGVLNIHGHRKKQSYMLLKDIERIAWKRRHKSRHESRHPSNQQSRQSEPPSIKSAFRAAMDLAKKEQESYKQLEEGGPLSPLVKRLTNEICEENVELGSCTFADQPLEAAIDTVFKGADAEIWPKAPFFITGFVPSLGQTYLLEDRIDAFKKCDSSKFSKTLPQVSETSTLQDLEKELGGPLPITMPAGSSSSVPEGLRELGEVYYNGNCDFTWWTVFSPCPAGLPGFVYIDNSTGVLRVDCDIAEIAENSAAKLGPVRKVFLRVSFGDDRGGNRWSKYDKAADDVSTRDFFVLIAPPEASEFVSTIDENLHNTKLHWYTKPRRFRLRAYAQLDPRIAATRESICSDHRPSTQQDEDTLPHLEEYMSFDSAEQIKI